MNRPAQHLQRFGRRVRPNLADEQLYRSFLAQIDAHRLLFAVAATA